MNKNQPTFDVPVEIYKQIMFLLKPYQLIDLCQINKYTSTLCQDDNFWHEYILNNLSPEEYGFKHWNNNVFSKIYGKMSKFYTWKDLFVLLLFEMRYDVPFYYQRKLINTYKIDVDFMDNGITLMDKIISVNPTTISDHRILITINGSTNQKLSEELPFGGEYNKWSINYERTHLNPTLELIIVDTKGNTFNIIPNFKSKNPLGHIELSGYRIYNDIRSIAVHIFEDNI
jgi:hypothetical protein